jgi:signal recognition particle subunit SRP54
MGDVVLVERAQEQFDEEEARKSKERLLKMSLVLMISSQIQQVKKMGNMKDLVGMIPGASKGDERC